MFLSKNDAYNKVVKEHIQLSVEIIEELYDLCLNETIKQRNNIFFDYVRKYCNNNIDKTYEIILKWVQIIDVNELLKSSGGKSYSSYNSYYIIHTKALGYVKDSQTSVLLLSNYKNSLESFSLLNEPDYWITYNVCKNLYIAGNIDDARLLYNDLVLYRRDPNTLFLPIKYKDISNPSEIVPSMLELIIPKKFDHYQYNTFVKYLKSVPGIHPIFRSLTYANENNSFNFSLEALISSIMEYVKANNLLLTGKISTITKSGVGFIKDESMLSYFVPAKYMDRKYKRDKTVIFYSFKSINPKDLSINQAAYIIKEDNHG